MFLGLPPAQTILADDSGDGRSFQHVFVIVLENEGYNTTFGTGSKAPYLSFTSPTLTRQGVLPSQYYGQAATPETRSDCQEYQEFALAGVTPDGQAMGSGWWIPPLSKRCLIN